MRIFSFSAILLAISLTVAACLSSAQVKEFNDRFKAVDTQLVLVEKDKDKLKDELKNQIITRETYEMKIAELNARVNNLNSDRAKIQDDLNAAKAAAVEAAMEKAREVARAAQPVIEAGGTTASVFFPAAMPVVGLITGLLSLFTRGGKEK